MRKPGLPTILPAVVGAVLVLGMHCFQTSILAQDTRRPAIADVSWRRSSDGGSAGRPALVAAPPEPAAPTASDALPPEPYTASLRMEGDSDGGDAADPPYDPISPTDPVEAPAPAVIASRQTPATPWAKQAEPTPRRTPHQADVSMPAPPVEGRVPADPASGPVAPVAAPYRPIDPVVQSPSETPDQTDLAVRDVPADESVADPDPIAAIAPIDPIPAAREDAPSARPLVDTPRRQPSVQPHPPTASTTPGIAATAPDLPVIAVRQPRPMVIRPIRPTDPVDAPIDNAEELTAAPADDDISQPLRPVRTLTPNAPSVESSRPAMAQARADRTSRDETRHIEPVVIAAPAPVTVDIPAAEIQPDLPEVLASVDTRQEASPTTEVRTQAPTTRENDDAKPDPDVIPERSSRPSDPAHATHPTKDRNLMLMMALQDPDKYVRKWAVEMLGGTGDKRAVKPLIRRLGDSDWWVRRAAMYSLMQLDDDAAVKPITALLRKGHWKDQQVAAIVLGKMKAESAIPALMVQLADADDRVRVACAAALGQLGSPQAVSALQKAMRDDDKAVRLAAKRALKRIAESKVVSR
ncbi:MAG: HEAT repeat domain-containing protein [Phycisphaerae bacterium]